MTGVPGSREVWTPTSTPAAQGEGQGWFGEGSSGLLPAAVSCHGQPGVGNGSAEPQGLSPSSCSPGVQSSGSTMLSLPSACSSGPANEAEEPVVGPGRAELLWGALAPA